MDAEAGRRECLVLRNTSLSSTCALCAKALLRLLPGCQGLKGLAPQEWLQVGHRWLAAASEPQRQMQMGSPR